MHFGSQTLAARVRGVALGPEAPPGVRRPAVPAHAAAAAEAGLQVRRRRRGRRLEAHVPADEGPNFYAFLPKTRIFRWIFTKNTASTDSHSRRSLRSLLECSCCAFLVARYRSLLEMR